MKSLPSVRALALSASLAAHSGIAVLAYGHAPRSHAPATAPSVQAVEVSLAELPDPEPALEPPAPREARAEPQSNAIARLAPAAPARAGAEPAAVAVEQSPVSPATPAESASAPVRFVMQAPVVSGSATQTLAVGSADAHGASDAHGDAQSADNAPLAENQVDRPAKLQSGTPPSYTAAAEAAGVEVELPLEVVIDRTGSVQSARTLQHVGYGLDEAAVAAVRRYRFSPAWRAGKPVAVRMRWLLRFQLR